MAAMLAVLATLLAANAALLAAPATLLAANAALLAVATAEASPKAARAMLHEVYVYPGCNRDNVTFSFEYVELLLVGYNLHWSEIYDVYVKSTPDPLDVVPTYTLFINTLKATLAEVMR